LAKKDKEVTQRLQAGAPDEKTLVVLSASSEQESKPNQNHRPEAQRRLRINEAIGTIEGSIRNGDLAQAVEALRFAVDLLGQFPQVETLYRRMRSFLEGRVIRLRRNAQLSADGMAQTMENLAERGLLTVPFGERLQAWIEELDPGNPRGGEILGNVKRLRQHSDPKKIEKRSQRQAEAVARIESLLAEGKVELAQDTLRFAIDLLGKFEQVPHLEEKIARALGTP
jgi:hypothetical protein